jgi:hypothetical protein
MSDNAIPETANDELIEPDSPDERGRSTVKFPYFDLDDAVKVAKAVNSVGGSNCDWDQLAAKLGQAASGGGFRQRALTAKTFGFIDYSKGKVDLTQLGIQVCDPKQEKIARAKGFLKVELYRKVYEKFKGTALPPQDGLEAEMVSMGVASKQKDKARQVFQRSATQGGFFWSGHDRLVMPPNTGSVKEPTEQEHEGDKGGVRRTGLIDSLPAPHGQWPTEKRVQWLHLAVAAFNLMYDQADGEIEISVRKENPI